MSKVSKEVKCWGQRGLVLFNLIVFILFLYLYCFNKFFKKKNLLNQCLFAIALRKLRT